MGSSNLKEFTFEELKTATNNFSLEALLGRRQEHLTGYGRVYKGWIDEKTMAPSKTSGIGMAVAIKMFQTSTVNSWDFDRIDGIVERIQGFELWQSEINVLGRYYHPNLIGLLGYCWEGEKVLLVYEFMHNGSVYTHLFEGYGVLNPLSWNTRLKIAVGAARGLAFLHTLENKVIYKDFRTSNIMLDENFNVKLSNLSLAMRGPRDEDSHVTTSYGGMYQYTAPEYVFSGTLYMKSDVYAFGIVLLELLTGLCALYETQFVQRLRPMLSKKRNLKTIMDVSMGGRYSTEAAFQVAELTLKCLEGRPENRPSMKEVAEVLKQIDSMEKTDQMSESVC